MGVATKGPRKARAARPHHGPMGRVIDALDRELGRLENGDDRIAMLQDLIVELDTRLQVARDEASNDDEQ